MKLKRMIRHFLLIVRILCTTCYNAGIEPLARSSNPHSSKIINTAIPKLSDNIRPHEQYVRVCVCVCVGGGVGVR